MYIYIYIPFQRGRHYAGKRNASNKKPTTGTVSTCVDDCSLAITFTQ